MKTSVINGNSPLAFLLLITGILFIQTATVNAQQQDSYPGLYSPLYLERQSPKYIIQTISRLRQALINEEDMEKNSKRSEDIPVAMDFEHERKRLAADFGTDRARPGMAENRLRLFNTIGR